MLQPEVVLPILILISQLGGEVICKRSHKHLYIIFLKLDMYLWPGWFCVLNTYSDSYTYDVKILLTSAQKGEIRTTEEALRICLISSTDDGFKFCPGLNVTEYYEQYHSAIGYNIQSVRVWEKPFKHVDSVNCLLWHQISSNVREDLL